MIRRVFVEDKNGHAAKALLNDIKASLNIKSIGGLRILQRYDAEGLDSEVYNKIKNLIFREAPVENLYEETFPLSDDETVFGVEYLPGQFDQRADSAEQCIQIAALKRPKVACAKIYVLKGNLSQDEIEQIKKYLINAVDSREASLDKPQTLERKTKVPADIQTIDGFANMDEAQIAALHKKMSLAMSVEDLAFCRDYFAKDEKRDPSITEIRVLDTYWSDHCRHTTFLTKLEDIKIEDAEFNTPAKISLAEYSRLRGELKLD